LQSYRHIIQPGQTRWNSLAVCVDLVVKEKKTLRVLAADTGHDLHTIIPTDQQFEVLEEFLEPFHAHQREFRKVVSRQTILTYCNVLPYKHDDIVSEKRLQQAFITLTGFCEVL
jgi:hypothetical protein